MKRAGMLAAVLLLAGCGSSTHRLVAARFPAGHGWHVGANAKAKGSWAVLHGPPTDPGMWMGHGLRSSGIAISLNLGPRRSKVFYDYGRGWPPRVARTHLGGLEGVPARMPVFQWYGRIKRRWEAALIIIFGQSPTNVQLARANAELRSARIP